MIEITVACIAAIGSLLVAIVNGVMQNRKNKDDIEYRKKREEVDRKKEEIYAAILDGVHSTLEATDISLIAIQGGHLNGNVEAARDKVSESKARLEKAKSDAILTLL